MIEHFIYSLLNNNAGVSALVATRIYPLELPQNAVAPAVTYSTNEDAEIETIDGQGTFQNISVEFDCWAVEHADMIILGDAVKSAIKNYSGTLEGVVVDKIRVEGVTSVFEHEEKKYRRTILATITKQ